MNYKMANFAIYYQNSNEPEIRIINTIINKLAKENKNLKIYFFLSKKINFDYPINSKVYVCPTLKYLSDTRSDRMYQSFLKFCKSKKIDFAFIPRLNYPEFFYNDLIFNRKIKTKFILQDQSLSLIRFSEVRSNIVIKLIKHRNVKKFILDNLNGKEGVGPKYFEHKVKKLKSKIIRWYQWRDSEPKILNKDTCLKKLNLSNKKFTILFFGFPFYGKGIDIFISAIKYFNRDFQFLISSNLKLINFDYDLNILEKYKKNNRVKTFEKYVSIKKREQIFGAADLICLPYRKSYTFQSSGVLTEAILFNKFYIAPNINPFNQFNKKYKNLGLMFNPENVKSLVSTIRKSKKILASKEYRINYSKDRTNYLKDSADANNIHKEINKLILKN